MNTLLEKKLGLVSLIAFPAIKDLGLGCLESVRSADAIGEELYTAYYARIHKYFSFRLFDKSEAEDLAQTVFLKVFSSLKKGLWDGEGDLRYIFAIARNTLIDYFRRNKHTVVVSDEIVSDTVSTLVTSGPMEDREEREIITAAMQGLRTEEMRAVSFRFFSDMEYPLIAQMMGKREDAVRQLVHRGLKSLRANLEPQASILRF